MARFLALFMLLLLSACATAPKPQPPTPVVATLPEPPPPKAEEPKPVPGWKAVDSSALATYPDQDIQRQARKGEDWAGMTVHEKTFTENGFSWSLVRFASKTKPNGPLWAVPHDDEDAAFDAMIETVKLYGGVGIVVNSTGEGRNQPGYGACGVRSAYVSNCDPNRNFSDTTPLFTSAFLDQLRQGQPIIALHTNREGFHGDGHGGGGDITVLDETAARSGQYRPARNAFFGNGSVPALNNYDTFPLKPFRAEDGAPDAQAAACRTALNARGIHFWHERVGNSDGSMSNYVVLNRWHIPYINIESRAEVDLKLASDRHMAIMAAMWEVCGGYFVKN